MSIFAFLILLAAAFLFFYFEVFFLGWLCAIATVIYVVASLITGTARVATKGGQALTQAVKGEVKDIEAAQVVTPAESVKETGKELSKQAARIFGEERPVPPEVPPSHEPPLPFKAPPPLKSHYPPEMESISVRIGEGCKSFLDALAKLFK
jgi:hypothetical protein